MISGWLNPSMHLPRTSQYWFPEKAMATHSSTLAWKLPWTEEPGGLQSMGSQRVRHDWAFAFMHWRRKWQPTPAFLPGESQGGAWWAAVYGVAQSRTRLKRLSSSSQRWFKSGERRPNTLHLPSSPSLGYDCLLSDNQSRGVNMTELAN